MDGQTTGQHALGALPEAKMGKTRVHDGNRIPRPGYRLIS